MLFLWPVSRLLGLGLTTSWLDSLLTVRIGHIVWFTIWQALTCAALCIVLALPSAYVLHLRRFRGQAVIQTIISVPFITPTVVVAITFSSLRHVPVIGHALFGNSPIVAIIWAQVFMNYGLMVRAIGNAWIALDPASENAAALDGAGRVRTFLSITLPQLASALTSSALLVFLYCATSFGIVLVLGGGNVHSIETEMYGQALQRLEIGTTAGLAIIQTLITTVAFLAFYRLGKPTMNLINTASMPERKALDRSDWPAVMVTSVVIAVLILTPLIAVINKAFTFNSHWSLENFSHLASFGARNALSITVGQAAFNSLRNLVVATSIAMLVGTRVSYLLARTTTSHRMRQLWDTLFQMPVGISSVVLGLGYLITFSNGLLPLRTSWLVIPLVQALIATPLVIRLLYPAIQSVDSEVTQSAETDGATAEQVWWLVQAPMIQGALQTAVGFVALISLGEFGAANFLAYGNQGTLPTVLYQLISRPGEQNYGMAMATSVLLIAVSYVVVAVSSLRKQPGFD